MTQRALSRHTQAGRRFTGSVALPRVTLAPNDAKRCTGCKRDLRAADFGPAKGTKDGLAHRCRKCRAEYETTRSQARRRKRKNEHWRTLAVEQRDALTARLVKAADKAATLGMWNGREALRAYRDLREALHRFNREPPRPEALGDLEIGHGAWLTLEDVDP